MPTKDSRNDRFASRRFLVTGGASGIGAATARRLASEGGQVAVLDRNGVDAEAIAKEIGGLAVTVDLADAATIAPAVVAVADQMGGIDGLVNAAGINPLAPFAQTTPEIWTNTMAINLTGPFLVTAAALPYLERSKHGAVVNLSSGAAMVPIPNRSAYIASKGGIISLTKALALELAPRIRVNVVCPGGVDTPMIRNEFKSEDAITRISSRYALGRMAAASEIAASIAFLCSDDASYITGSAISVDGGRTYH